MRKGLLLLLFSIIIICINSIGQNFPTGNASKKKDSLLTVLKTQLDDTNKVNTLNALCDKFSSLEKREKRKYAIEALLLSQKLNYKKGEGIAYANKGWLFFSADTVNYPEAFKHYFKALKIFEESGNPKKIADIYQDISTLYYNQGNFEEGLRYSLKTLDTYEAMLRNTTPAHNTKEFVELKYLLGSKYIGVGDVYSSKFNQHDKGLDYAFKYLNTMHELAKGNTLLTKADSVKNGIRTASAMMGIGEIYARKGSKENALKYTLKGFDMMKANKPIDANIYFRLGHLYELIEDYTKALEYYYICLTMDSKNKATEVEYALRSADIGRVLIKQKEYKRAEKHLLEALPIFERWKGLKDRSLKIYADLVKVDSALENYKSAFEHQQLYMKYKDEISKEENAKKTIETQMQYEFDKKETLANAEQAKKDMAANDEKRKQRIILYSVTIGLLLVIFFAIVLYRSLNVTRKQKQIIEQKNKETEQQKLIIEDKNQNITDSINYAQLIQKAKLPELNEVKLAFPNSFILYRPKDIVSGDFYYFHKGQNLVFIAAADCTGHGVPGAFMSMICSEKLDDAIAQSNEPSEILEHVNNGIRKSLRQDGSREASRDGMDIAFCKFDAKNRLLKYSGAGRPLWIIRSGQTTIEEIKPTKKSIGGFTSLDQHFQSHEVQLFPNDVFYIFSDGYTDAFNGETDLRLGTKKLKELFLSIQNLSMEQQHTHLADFLDKWQGNSEQIDDILVIGIKV